jgi:hypothetical protein
MSHQTGSRGERAQSETLGFILIFAVLILGVTVIVTFGSGGIDETEDELAEDRAENTLSQFDSKAALVALGESDSHRVSFPLGGSEQLTLQEDRGWMNVTAVNQTTGERLNIMNITLGAIVYDGGDTRLAYQGGGVWRAGSSGGLMISPPEFHYRDATLTLPAITVTGDTMLGDSAVISRTATERMFPNENVTNPLDEHRVTVTVGSEFYRGWGEYFEDRTDGNVTYDHDRDAVEMELISPVGTVRIDSAVSGEANSGKLLFQANPSHPCDGSSKPPYFDRYNSDDPGTYCDQYDEDEIRSGGEFIFGGNVESQASAGEIQGEIVSGGAVDLHHKQPLHGNVTHIDGCSGCADAQTEAENDNPSAAPPGGYWIERTDEVRTASSVDYIIQTLLREFRNNLNTTTVSNGDELDAGQYYLEEIDLGSGERLVLNTTGGDITLGVNKSIHLNDAQIDVKGDGEANIYVGGSETEDELQLTDSDMFVPESNATRLAILGGEDFTGMMTNSNLTGVIYAPAGQDGNGEVEMIKGSAVYGGIVTGDMTIGNPGGGTVHHDAALSDEQIVPPDLGILRVTFLHVTRNEIHVSDR